MTACAAARVFTLAEIEKGWPEALSVAQAAALQRPFPLRDVEGRRRYIDLMRVLETACVEALLPCESATKKRMVSEARDVHPGLGGWEVWPDRYRGLDGTPLAYTEPAEYRDVTTRHIKPRDLQEWLAAQRLEPSEHVAAWFDASGVALNRPTVLQVVPSVPASSPVSKTSASADVPPFASRELPGGWTDAKLLDEHDQLRSSGVKNPTTVLAEQVGIPARTLRQRLSKERENRNKAKGPMRAMATSLARERKPRRQ